MAKRNSQLVCQHLEGVSRATLERYQDVIRDFVRGHRFYNVGLADDRGVVPCPIVDRVASSSPRGCPALKGDEKPLLTIPPERGTISV